MRKIIFSTIILLAALCQNGQAQDTTRTLIKFIKPQTIGLYVAPEISYGQLSGDMTGFGGASAMFVLNKKWAVGVTGQSSMSETFVPKNTSPLAVKGSFVGGKIEYTPRPDALIHVSFPLTIGGGEASVDSVHTTHTDYLNEPDLKSNDGNRNSNGFVVVQPGINLEMNLLRYAKIYVGANYRLSFLTDNQTALLPANTLQGFAISAGLKVGLFDFNVQRRKKMSLPN